MKDSITHTKPATDIQPDIEAMYQAFMATNELQYATQQILDLATHLTGAENCSLMLLNGHGELYILNSRGLEGATLKASRMKVGEGISGQVALQGNALLVEDIASDERFSEYKRNRYRTGSFIACPITSEEKVIGVLNLNDKKSGEPFNPEDFDQAKLISLMASVALRSFLGESHIKLQKEDIEDIYHRIVEAECNNREFVARIAYDMRTPLYNIKGAAYFLQNSSSSDKAENPTDKTGAPDYYEIIAKEVNYLISYLDAGIGDYERLQVKLDDIEEKERYKNLLE